jgi:hypothetical protein
MGIENLTVTCPHCKGPRKHAVLHQKEVKDYSEEAGIHWWDDYLMIQCRGCETISFSHRSSNSEDFDDDGQSEITERLYPSRSVRDPMEHSYYLPKKASAIYKETLVAVGNSAPILAAVGLRAVVESICQDRQCQGKNLEKSIDLLIEHGFLSKEQGQFLHLQRYLGNTAIHEIEPPDVEDIDTSLDIVESLLKTLYVLPKLAERIKRRQAARSVSEVGCDVVDLD